MVEKIVRKALGQNGPDVTFLKQEGVAAESGQKLLQAFGHARAAAHALELCTEHIRGYWRLPDGLERRRFLKVGPHLALQGRARHRLLERFRRPDLVRVVDALDRLLGPDAVLEGQIACNGPGGGGEQSARRED